MIDIKVVGIVNILILLVLGYFVYTLYKDSVFLKKGIEELRGLESNQNWNYIEQESERDYETSTEEEEDEELQRHLETFLDEGPKHLPTIQEEQEIEQVIEPELELDSVPAIIKKRKNKTK